MTEHFSTNMNHQPTRSYYDWLVKIISEIHPKTILEVGAAWGISTHAFLEVPDTKLVTVDKNECQPAHQEVADLGAGKRWSFILGDSREVLPSMEPKEFFDLVYIDGDHSAEGATIDLKNGWELVKPGGYILMDDIMHAWTGDAQHGINVLAGFRELIFTKQLSAKIYPSWNGFAIIQKPNQ